MTGTTLSHYRITGELGRGGMGIVYLAEDTKLDRQVAIKVLPPSALASDDDRARFYREAKAAAQLHHAHIASVFEIDEAIPDNPSGGEAGEARPFIVMEYIEGSTLSEQIAGGPVKLEDAVRITREIAEALKIAHAKDIVHRDIKSSNVMVTPDGIAKVLDFGLAKTAHSTMLTRMGSTLGTVAYMSPEQARGEEVDARSDLYSLGTVLYEMVAGRRPYSAEYEQAVVYGILNEPAAPLTSVRTGVPFALEQIVSKCLEKDRELRYQSAAGLIADLKAFSRGGSTISRSAMSTAHMSAVSAPGPGSSGPGSSGHGSSGPGSAGAVSKSSIVVPLGIGLLCLAIGAAAMRLLQPEPEAPPLRRLEVRIDQFLAARPTISPDGRYWAFEAADSMDFQGVTVYDVRTGEYTRIPESNAYQEPKLSPDGQWLMMSNSNETVISVLPQGRPTRLPVNGISSGWYDMETVILTDNSGGFTFLDLDGGQQEYIDLTSLDSTVTRVTDPARIPGTDHIMFTSYPVTGFEPSIVSYDRSAGTLKTLSGTGCCAQPAGDDIIVYQMPNNPGQLVGQNYDPGDAELKGTPLDLAGVEMSFLDWGVGLDGTLLYSNENALNEIDVLSLMDAGTGKFRTLDVERAQFDRLSVSPDGSKVAVEWQTSAIGDAYIAVIDLETGVSTRLTSRFDISRAPTWSPDGRIYYAAGPIQNSDIYVKNADGTGSEELVVEGGDYPDISSDGRWLAYASGPILMAMDLETGETVRIDSSFARQGDPKISPDGQYIVFTADTQISTFTSGAQRMYVRSFPDPTRSFVKLTEDYADDPAWAADGSAIYFRNRGKLYELPVDVGDVFRKRGSPRPLRHLPGLTVRLEVNPVTGDLIISHPPESTDMGVGVNYTLIESLPSYLEYLRRQ